MKENRTQIIFAIFFAMIFGIAFSAQGQSAIKMSTQAEIQEDVAKVACKNSERLEAVKKLFLEKGAAEADVKIDEFKYVENLVVEKPGETKEIVVIGAHYDEAGGGCGAIDNWTGIVIIANLYKTLKPLTTKKTYKFVAFGQEEQGLIGSKAMADAIPKEARENYCAMVNLDSFGLTYPQVMRNISDDPLIDLAKETAKNMKLPFSSAAIEGSSSDSASFQSKKIPALGLHGLTGRWRDYLHSSRDKVENVNPQSVYYGYRYALNILAGIDSRSCDAFRKK